MEQPMQQDPMAAAAPVEPGMEPAPEQQGIGGAQQASPEEQGQYEHFVAKAYDLIYDRAMMPKIIDMLAGEGDPTEGLARAAALVIKRVMDMAEGAGEKLAGDVILHAGTEVFEDLANLSKVAKIKDFSQDQDAFEGAYFKTLDMFRTMLQESGRLDEGAAKKDLETLMAMDKDGKLEEMFRGLADEDEKGMEPKGDAPEPGMPSGGLMQEAK